MKKAIVAAWSLCAALHAQNSAVLMGSYWNGSAEISRHMNTGSGGITNLATLANVSGVVQGETTFDLSGGRYFNNTTSGIMAIDAATGTVIAVVNPSFALRGIEYCPSSGALVGTYWTGSQEMFASMNIATGQVSNIAAIPGVTYVTQGETTFDAAGNRYFQNSQNGIRVISAGSGSVLAVITNSSFRSMEYDPSTGKLLGVYWNGSSEIFASLDITTGIVTNIATLPGVQGIVQGESSYDAQGNRYFIKTNLGISTIDASTGSVITTFSNTTKGIEFMGTAANPCSFQVSVSPVPATAPTGTSVLFVATTSAANAAYQWQSDPAGFGWMNVPNNSMYSGGNTPFLVVNPVRHQHHLQPFRVLLTSGTCPAVVSNTTFIAIADTCIVTDTIHEVVTDSLVIRLLNTANPSITENVIHVFPNPATSELTIDAGNLITMQGYSIRITTSAGDVVYASKFTAQVIKVELSRISAEGLYYIQVLDPSDAIRETRKIIVRH